MLFGSKLELDTLFIGSIIKCAHHHTDDGHHIAVSPIRVADFGIHLRYIEQLIDESQQSLALAQNHSVERFRLFFRRQIALHKAFACPENHRERRAEFVGDIGKKRGARLLQSVSDEVGTALMLKHHIERDRHHDKQAQANDSSHDGDAKHPIRTFDFGVLRLEFLIFEFGIKDIGLARQFFIKNAVGKCRVTLPMLHRFGRIGRAQCFSHAPLAATLQIAIADGGANFKRLRIIVNSLTIIMLHAHNIRQLRIADSQRIILLRLSEHRQSHPQFSFGFIVAF